MSTATILMLLLVDLTQSPGAAVQVPPRAEKPAGEGARKDAAAPRSEELKRSASAYRIARNSEPPKDLVMRPEPVLVWTNPLRRTFAGAVFVWVADGRPEAVASIFRYTEEGRAVEDNEFQSLATTGLTARRGSQTVWDPHTAGLTLSTIPGAPPPGATAAERLRQMHALAREFHAYFDVPEDRSELRLLPKPLYRYEADRPDLKDGALFAFVLTTDPEVLLVIEDRPIDGKPTWHYGFARMSMVNLRAKHKGRDVWSVGWATDLRNPNEPYVTLRASDRAP
jgi:hypothetical protein